MESQQAEIEALSDSAKVDSDATGDESDGSAPSGKETPAASNQGQSAQSPEKKRDEVNERFDKLTRDLYELRGERDRDRFELTTRDQRIKELEAQLESAKPRQVAPDTLPTLESVGYDEQKYAAALTQHFERVAESRGEAAAQRALEKYMSQQSAQTARSAWAKREAEYIKSNPDYVDKVQNARTLPISDEMQSELLQLEDGPQIAHYLVENREKALLIMQLPHGAQLRELGRIQALLEAKKQAAPPVSKAPPPVTKVDGSAVVGEKPEAEMTDAEWARRREKLANFKGKKRA